MREAYFEGRDYFELAESLLCDELAVALDMEREVTRDFLVERVSARVEQWGEALPSGAAPSGRR